MGDVTFHEPEAEPFAPDPGPYLLATLDQLKARLNTREGDIEEELLTELLESASDRVRKLSGREFKPVNTETQEAIVRTASAFGSRMCQAHDVRELEVITADGVDVTDRCRLIRLRPEDPAHAVRLPFPADQVKLTGWFGFATVPPSIRDAVLGWAQRTYHETRSRLADSHVDPDGMVQNYFRSVPLFVSQPISSYRIPGL